MPEEITTTNSEKGFINEVVQSGKRAFSRTYIAIARFGLKHFGVELPALSTEEPHNFTDLSGIPLELTMYNQTEDLVQRLSEHIIGIQQGQINYDSTFPLDLEKDILTPYFSYCEALLKLCASTNPQDCEPIEYHDDEDILWKRKTVKWEPPYPFSPTSGFIENDEIKFIHELLSYGGKKGEWSILFEKNAIQEIFRLYFYSWIDGPLRVEGQVILVKNHNSYELQILMPAGGAMSGNNGLAEQPYGGYIQINSNNVITSEVFELDGRKLKTSLD